MQLIEGPNDQDAAPEEMPAQANSDDTLIALWLAGKADRTRRAYQDDVAAFLRFVGKPLRQVKLADLVAYGETLDRLAPASRARKLGAVKSLASFGHRTGARSDQRDSYLPHQSAAPGDLLGLAISV